jgi:arabinan endo-1,5-alpha-L-arabinosidase
MSSAGTSGADAGATMPDASTGAGSGGSAGGGAAGAGAGGDAAGSGGSSPGEDPDRCEVAKSDPAQPPTALALMGNLGTHDPVLIAAHGRYYLFFTGREDVRGLAAKTWTDLITWRDAPVPLSPNPAWVAQRVPEARNLWAPDISFFNGLYHLYYSASSFGQRTSCIGHATRAALDSGNWEDHGAIICSSNSDQWNAIDPNLVIDEAGTPWLSFGSFWGGLKLIELTADGARKGDQITAIAARPDAGGAIEAPFIVRRCGYYYLFASFDRCCQGATSTYNIRVGRSEKVTGPYVDASGKPMMEGGGTLLVDRAGSWRGPGHNAVLFDGDKAYNVYHAYRSDNGAPQLRIAELAWNADGWPVSGGP